MSIQHENAPQLPPIALLGGAFATGAVYASVLSIDQVRQFELQHTWFVTVIGVFLTLGWLAVHDPKAAGKAFVFFVTVGIPIIARALLLESGEKNSIANREMK